MNNEKVAALLEVISFFFVGIDFYGSERLRKAQTRLLSSSQYLRARIDAIQNFEWKKGRANKFMIVVYTLSVLVAVVYLELNAGFFSAIPSATTGELVGGTIGFVFACGFVLMMILLLIAFIIGILNVTISLVNYCVRGLITALQAYHMEGVLLFIGTLLFIVSKYVQFYL